MPLKEVSVQWARRTLSKRVFLQQFPAGVARTAKEEGMPCIAVCGGVGERIDVLYDIGIHAVFTLCKGPQSLESAIKDGHYLLAQRVEQVVRTFMAGRHAG